MLALVDVDYRATEAVAACLEVADWSDAEPVREAVARLAGVADYRPGAFFERELPCLIAVLEQLPAVPQVIVVDGYVWLDAGQTRPGLGAHLFSALDGAAAVVGVAKNRFAGAGAEQVLRGDSARPLYVTAAGMTATEAAARVRGMHGAHRTPALLTRVDRLARDTA